MKLHYLKIFAGASIICALALHANAVTLTVSPSVTSNTYTGVITLTITGLTNTEKVTVQKFLDLNANGAIDANEPMVDVFKVMDGSAMLIGGVTNLNVPFDSNPAGGAITTTLNFVPALILENIVGQQIFRVTSSTGSVTATLTVTNAALGQGIAGTVFSNGVACPYAVVVAQDQKLNDPAGAVVADANGKFFLALPPSSYTPIASTKNFYFDTGATATMTVSNGLSATNNLFLTNGTTTVSGNIYDSGNSNAIGGMLVLLQSHSLFAIAFTDTNGNYSALVPPNFWKIQPAKQRLARRAYVIPSATFQVNATAGDVTNANEGLPKGTAMFYGRVVNNSNAPLANLEVDSGTSGNVNNSYDAKGYSDANGNYTVMALGDVTNQWASQINNAKNAAVANYIFNSYNTLALNPNQSVHEDFIALPATATISGNVKDNSGTNVVGVTLEANATINGLNYNSLDGTTDSSGNYSLAVASGQWNLQFLVGGFSDNLDTHGYEDISAPHIVTIPPTNVVLNFVVYPLGTPFFTALQRISPTQFGFTVNGTTNVNYTVQVSADLVNWLDFYSFTLTNNNNSVPLVDNAAMNSPRFYRVRSN